VRIAAVLVTMTCLMMIACAQKGSGATKTPTATPIVIPTAADGLPITGRPGRCPTQFPVAGDTDGYAYLPTDPAYLSTSSKVTCFLSLSDAIKKGFKRLPVAALVLPDAGGQCTDSDHQIKVTADGDIVSPSDTNYDGTVAQKCYFSRNGATQDDLVVHAPKIKASKDGKYPLTGTLTAPSCGGGYNLENTDVTIRNEKDEIIASATTSASTTTGTCTVKFSVEVPKASFYQLRIGTHGAPTYSFDDLQNLSFNLELGFH